MALLPFLGWIALMALLFKLLQVALLKLNGLSRSYTKTSLSIGLALIMLFFLLGYQGCKATISTYKWMWESPYEAPV